ncbi:DUF2779 domain-containing protein [Salinibacter ruber]|uniref:DUF2779 domain-containing protein n=1 Tax=Salinibacter ruber TaxID=146919 RepID=UPI002169061E|nr:DUF2779 domain-containing protein [Salinibacter ruber]MCS4134316.1 CRISPR/Cas system-associated exonuclease Cas4 (RecB family) [Salinibacter ruber]
MPKDIRLALKEIGPDGYKVRHAPAAPAARGARGSSAGGVSDEPRREPLGPDQLTKSRYMTGVTESKREMWFEARGELSPDVGERWRMEQGNLAAELAREEFPEGTFVGGPPSEAQLQPTRPLFEVRFSVGDMTIRVDVLRPAPSGGWVVTEIKSSTMTSRSSRKEARQDVAFQAYVLSKAGLPLQGAEVMHLNPEYVHPDGGELFARTDLTGELGEQIQEARENAPEFTSVLRRDEPPNLWPSRSCNTCDCPEPCHSLPEHSVLTLPRLYYGHLDEIIEEGRWTLEELQGHSHLKPKHENYIQAAQAGEPYVDTSEVRDALSELEYPLYFLDFEAIDYALPPFEGTSPWEKVPFQYSLHVVEEGQPLGREEVAHEEFLGTEEGDPRRPLAERLVQDIGPVGSIVVYNATFEKGILEDLQEAFPQWEDQFQNYTRRLWDQGEIFQEGHYVHPSQKGSWSLKTVLPAFDPDLKYGDLDVQEGMEAVVQYSRMISPETSDSEAREIGEDLLAYCEQDTWAMVVIHRELSDLVDREPTAPIA